MEISNNKFKEHISNIKSINNFEFIRQKRICNDNYIWTCPLCFKKFRDKKEHDEEIYEEEKDIVVSPSKTNKHKKDKSLSKTDIKSIIYRNIEQKENFNA